MAVPAPQQPGRAGELAQVPANGSDGLTQPERRRSMRRSVIGAKLVPVRLGGEITGLALDVSETGMGLRAFRDLRAGSTTSLLFELPELKAYIEARALVTWVERTGPLWREGSGGRAGVRFLDLSDTARSLLTQWLGHQPPPLEARASSTVNHAAQEQAAAADPLTELRAELQLENLSGAAALQRIVERALAATGASGAAIALEDGNGIVCRATTGNAPHLGVRIQANSGLSGECVRTGQIVRCEDTESDFRVDAELCRQIHLRSALILPLYRGERLCGVLEAFSDRPRAFEAPHVLLLRRVCDLVVETAGALLEDLLPARAASETAQDPTPAASTASPASVAAPQSTRRAKRSVKAASLAKTIVCDVCGHANGRGRRICANCDVPLSVVENYLGAPTAEQTRAAEAAELVAGRLATSQNAVPVSAVPSRYRLAQVIAAAIVLLAGAALLTGVWKGARVQPEPQPAAVLSAEPLPQPAVPTPQAVAVESPAKSKSDDSTPRPPAAAKPAPRKQVAEAELEDEVAVIFPKPVPAAQPRPAVSEEIKPSPLPASNYPLPSFPQAVAVPELRVVADSRPTQAVSRGITGGKLVKKVAPVYPEVAKRTKKSGSISIAATVSHDGTLRNLRVLSGDPILADAALEAVRRWRYEPYRLNGKPIEVDTTIQVNFGPK